MSYSGVPPRAVRAEWYDRMEGLTHVCCCPAISLSRQRTCESCLLIASAPSSDPRCVFHGGCACVLFGGFVSRNVLYVVNERPATIIAVLTSCPQIHCLRNHRFGPSEEARCGAVVNHFVLSHANPAALDSLGQITRISLVVSVGKRSFVVRLNSGDLGVKITMFDAVHSVGCGRLLHAGGMCIVAT